MNVLDASTDDVKEAVAGSGFLITVLSSLQAVLRLTVGRTDSKLIALTPHVLHEDGDVQSSTAADNKGVCGVTRLNPQGQVALQLALKALLEVAAGHKLALLAGKG